MPIFNPTFLTLFGQVTLVLLLFAPSAHAAVPVETLSVTAEITENGTVLIEQSIQYVTPSQLEWQVFSKLDNLEVAADGAVVNSSRIQRRSNNGAVLLQSQSFATAWRLRYQAAGTLIRHNDRDQFFLKIMDQPGLPIYQTGAKFRLPQNNRTTNLSGNVYTLAGVDSPFAKVASPVEVSFSAQYSGPTALMTISANWDKGVISLSALEEARLSLSQLDAAPWLAFGVLLPLSSLVALIALLLRQKRQERHSEKAAEKPPSALPAALVGVLVRKKIYPEEIAALLIDLCQRGYLIIVKRGSGYYLARRKPLDEHVERWEQEIVEEMFVGNEKFSERQLQEIGSNRLYSPQVRDAFRRIYQVITGLSYFQENPHRTRVRNKLVALAMYYLSAAGMIWVAVTAGSPYLILPLAGTMLVATLIIKVAPKLAYYSPKGLQERRRWQEFGNYLRVNKPLPFESARNHTFEKYLPYAVALDCTLQWARRFDLSSITLIKPDWFVTYEESSSVELAKDIAGFTHQISSGISSLRGPLVS